MVKKAVEVFDSEQQCFHTGLLQQVDSVSEEIIFGEEDFFYQKLNETRSASLIKLGNFLIESTPGGKGSFEATVHYIDKNQRTYQLLCQINNERYTAFNFESFFPVPLGSALVTTTVAAPGMPRATKHVMTVLAEEIKPSFVALALGQTVDLEKLKNTIRDFFVCYDSLDVNCSLHQDADDFTGFPLLMHKIGVVKQYVDVMMTIEKIRQILDKSTKQGVLSAYVKRGEKKVDTLTDLEKEILNMPTISRSLRARLNNLYSDGVFIIQSYLRAHLRQQSPEADLCVDLHNKMERLVSGLTKRELGALCDPDFLTLAQRLNDISPVYRVKEVVSPSEPETLFRPKVEEVEGSTQELRSKLCEVLLAYIKLREKESSHWYQGLFKGYSKKDKLQASCCVYLQSGGDVGQIELIMKNYGFSQKTLMQENHERYLPVLNQARLGFRLKALLKSPDNEQPQRGFGIKQLLQNCCVTVPSAEYVKPL